MAGKAIHSTVDLRSGADALKQLPDATGDATALSGKFKTDGTAISNTQVATKQSLPPEEWTGAAADAASAEIQKLGAKTTELGQAFLMLRRRWRNGQRILVMSAKKLKLSRGTGIRR